MPLSVRETQRDAQENGACKQSTDYKAQSQRAKPWSEIQTDTTTGENSFFTSSYCRCGGAAGISAALVLLLPYIYYVSSKPMHRDPLYLVFYKDERP